MSCETVTLDFSQFGKKIVCDLPAPEQDLPDPLVKWRAELRPDGYGWAVRWIRHTVAKTTACGWQLLPYDAESLRTWRSFKTRYVSATKREALQELLWRRQYHAKKAEQRAKDAKESLKALQEFLADK